MGLFGGRKLIQYDVVCSECGESFKLPFLPTPGKPMYCKSCQRKLLNDLAKLQGKIKRF